VLQPKLTDFPQIILPLGIPFPDEKASELKVQNVLDVARSMIQSSSRFVAITLNQVLEDPIFGRQFWQQVAAGQPRLVKLKHIFEAVRVLALRKIQKNRTTDPIRLLLLGFEDLDGTDVELLRSTLMSGDSNLMQFRLGLLVLDADRSLFFTKYKKAGGKEGEAELQSWRQRHQRIIAKFLESEVLVLARMRMIKHIVDDVHVHMFGQVVRRVVREQTESGVDKEDMETPSSVDFGVQTCAADGRSVVATNWSRILR
jgi:hypothetical protein